MLAGAGAIVDAAAVAPLARGQPSANRGQVHTILTQCLSVMNLVFVARTDAWFKIVVQEGLQVENVWYRYDLGGRGAEDFVLGIDKSF